MATAVVTGAAGGIGRALAVRLAGQGHRVHLADLSPTGELAAELDGVSHVVDVSAYDDVERLAREVPDVDVLCLNAGIVGASMGPPWEVPPEEWQRVLGVNLLGVVNGLRAFVPRLIASGRPASLLVTGSLAGLVSFPGGGAYAASKHALVAVVEQVALALAGTPVSVTLLCPALVRSGMSAIGEEPDDVAATALEAVEEGRFLVVPAAWSPAVLTRGERLVSGEPPIVPVPASGTS